MPSCKTTTIEVTFMAQEMGQFPMQPEPRNRRHRTG